jgi:hypothetical protein
MTSKGDMEEKFTEKVNNGEITVKGYATNAFSMKKSSEICLLKNYRYKSIIFCRSLNGSNF